MLRFVKTVTLTAAILGWASPSSAFGWRALNGQLVNPEGPNSLEVVQRGGGISAADIWCAAGDFALRQMGVPGTQRVYLTEGKHIARTFEQRRFGYSFSIIPPPEAENFTTPPLTLDIRNIGDSLTAIQAQQYCYNRLGENEYLR